MKTREEFNCPQPDDSGFTRVDLLALLAALALLAVLALPSLGRGTEKTTIAQCAANLQQYDLALQIYGNENQDNLPRNLFGTWAWDISFSIAAFVTNTGVKWNALYCPGTFPRFTEQDNLNLFNYEPGFLSVLGYASTLPGSAGFAGAAASNINITLTLQRVSSGLGGAILPVKPASRALVADATLNDTGNASLYSAMLTYNWVSIAGGYQTYGQPHPHLSAHLKGNIPLGGNIGMLDGHVEWRNFQDMLPRTSSLPYFYW
jgi:prepilin-type processing-associated H-X9-DG protein